MSINETPGPIRIPAWAKIKGPWLCGQRFVEKFEQSFLTYSCKVTRGTYIPAADVPYGYFVSVTPFNAAESVLEILEIPPVINDPPDPPGTPPVHLFGVRTTKVNRYSEYICKATITKQIVPVGTEPDTGTMVWESQVVQIDDKHAEKTTVTATELELLTSHEWDESLNVYVTSDVQLVTSGGAASVTLVGNIVTHTTYKEVKCGWYLKTIDKFPKITARTYQTTIEFYWPGILKDFRTVIYDHKDGQVESFNEPVFREEAYKGPCKAEVTEDWSLTAPTIVAPQILKPLPISMSTPFADLNIGPTLHPAMFFNVTIQSDNPRYESVVHTYNWPATVPVEWPVNLWISDVVEPSRGGYLRTRINVFSPPLTALPIPP